MKESSGMNTNCERDNEGNLDVVFFFFFAKDYVEIKVNQCKNHQEQSLYLHLNHIDIVHVALF